MRSLRRRSPGRVRVSSRRLIELQAGALRAVYLQREVDLLERRARTDRAAAHAERLLAAAGSTLSLSQVAGASLPLTGEGDLHEAAFTALVDAMTWQRREEQLRTLTAGTEEKRA